jgi:prolyl-tRNA synthetase
MMHDGKALQAATSHYFGDGFSKAFDITFTDKENKLVHPFQTSWGCTTRMIGGVIMTHGDDNGLVLPPAIAPIQVVIIPVAQHKEGVLEKANEIKARLMAAGIRVKLDDSDNSAGWKYSEYEMKGVPLRLEIGPRDIESNQCVLVSRLDRQKTFTSLDGLEESVRDALTAVRDGLYAKALANRESRTFDCTTVDEIKAVLAEKGDCFIRAMWCGDEACEDAIKEQTGVGSRCIPLDQKIVGEKCACCGKEAKHMVLWAKAY